MQIFTHKETSRVIFYSGNDVTFLQSLEGSNLEISRIPAPVWNATRESCVEWKLITGAVMHVPGETASDPKVLLLNRKARLLNKVNDLIYKVRYPYFKHLIGQDYAYDRKHEDASRFLADPSIPLETLHYLLDEVEIRQKDPKIVALEIQRQRSERESIIRASERARRFLTSRISTARDDSTLNELENLVIERNFKIPMG